MKNKLAKLEDYVCCITLLSGTFILFINVCLRYLFAEGLPWAEESIRYLILVVVFIGLSVGTRKKEVIRIDFLLQLIKDNSSKKFIEAIINLASSVFLIWLAIIAFQFGMQTKYYGQVSPAMRLPIYILYLMIAFGSFLTAIRHFQELLYLFKGFKSTNSVKGAKY